MKFRKKPVVIEAWPVKALLYAAAHNWKDLPDSIRDAYENGGWVFGAASGNANDNGRAGIYVPTLEGNLFASADDMIIRGIKGEFYPCKPDIFGATYEPVEPQ